MYTKVLTYTVFPHLIPHSQLVLQCGTVWIQTTLIIIVVIFISSTPSNSTACHFVTPGITVNCWVMQGVVTSVYLVEAQDQNVWLTKFHLDRLIYLKILSWSLDSETTADWFLTYICNFKYKKVILITYDLIIVNFNSQVEQMSLWTDGLRCKLGVTFHDILYSDLCFHWLIGW